jgi:predicted O-methyltransferase YrrM
VRPSGLIAIDNALWHGDVTNPLKQDEDTLAIRAFNEPVSREGRLW